MLNMMRTQTYNTQQAMKCLVVKVLVYSKQKIAGLNYTLLTAGSLEEATPLERRERARLARLTTPRPMNEANISPRPSKTEQAI